MVPMRFCFAAHCGPPQHGAQGSVPQGLAERAVRTNSGRYFSYVLLLLELPVPTGLPDEVFAWLVSGHNLIQIAVFVLQPICLFQ